MERNCTLTALLLLTVITVVKGQYFDLFQGLQQFLQPGNDFVPQYNGVTRNPNTQRQTNRQENRKKTNEQRNQNQERRTQKPALNQYDYIFATTKKPSRKTTKHVSSQSSSNLRNISNKNQQSNLLLGDYYNNYDTTTKSNQHKLKTTSTTTANYYNNYNNRATTENVFDNSNFNKRPVTENVFESVNRKENYAVSFEPDNIYNNQNNRKSNNGVSNDNNNNFSRDPNTRDFSNNNQNNNRNNRDRGILNTDYNIDVPKNTRNPNVYGINPDGNRGHDNNKKNHGTNSGFINTDIDPDSNNFGNTGLGNRGSPSNRVEPNNNDRTTSITFDYPETNNNRGSSTNLNLNNYGVTASNNRGNSNNYDNNNNNNRGNSNNYDDNNNRGNSNNYDNNNNRGNSNNYDTNNRGNSNNYDNNNRGNPNNYDSNNRGSSNNYNDNNRGNSNNFDPNRGSNVNYPSDNPLINRPGVKPAPVDVDQPPITNKPLGNGNNFLVFNRPTDPGSITFTDGPEAEPEILIGPDEDDMTDRQKRRYLDLAERMCDQYKALTVKKVVALPLVPSPNPVELNVSDCTPVNVPLVIGGRVVSIQEFPHMALVGWMKTRTSGYSWKCGGSLISDRYVLTAGHCTYQDKDYDVVSGPPQAVQLGSSYLDDPGAVVVKVTSVIRHPKYKMRRSYHDVALIKMATKVSFSEVIRPACLGVPPPEGESIIATGWGRTEFGGDHSEELRSVSLPVWNMEECREIWGTSLKLPNGVTTDSHVCAGEKRGGKDTCQGDSGGPAQTRAGCAWRVVAVTSLGRSCGAPRTPALYAHIPRAFVAAVTFADLT